jgi:hypothetical protein
VTRGAGFIGSAVVRPCWKQRKPDRFDLAIESPAAICIALSQGQLPIDQFARAEIHLQIQGGSLKYNRFTMAGEFRVQ